MTFSCKRVARVTPWLFLATFVPDRFLAARENGARRDDSFPVKQVILPAALVAYGTIEGVMASRIHLLNYAIGHWVILHPPAKIKINDALQYFPVAGVYALQLAGVEGEHDFVTSARLLGLSALFMAVPVNVLKYVTREERPDKSARNSFPSGHTAMAFMGAEFLWQEYKDVSVWYGVAGYVIAVGTGACRVYNNKHWVGDVLFGAGIGILSTKLAYWIYPAIERALPGGGGGYTTLRPFYTNRQVGLSCSILFGHPRGSRPGGRPRQ